MPMGDQHELYHDEQSMVEGHLQHQSTPAPHQDPTGLSASTSPQLSNTPSSHKRKRDSIDDSEGRDDGRSVREGSGGGRRSSFKQPSPNLSGVGGSFLPINPNSAANQMGAQYNYTPIAMQPAPTAPLNGSATPESANAVLTAAGAMSGMLPQMTVPQPTLGYPSDGGQVGKGGEPGQMDNSFGTMSPPPADGHTEGVGGVSHAPSVGSGSHHGHGGMSVGPAGNPKPQVGTEEWHRVRRDNHKEVERRRRETINEGINELAKIVPGCEKNKGSILQRAVQYIQQLKENESSNIEKWTLEKLLTEQAIAELSANNEKLRKECEQAWREAETWKKSCLQAGVTTDNGGQASSS